MKTLKNIKLNRLSDAELQEREMSDLKGGNVCGCGCHYENSGGSSTMDNGSANVGIGSSGGTSSGGNNACYTDIGGTITGTTARY